MVSVFLQSVSTYLTPKYCYCHTSEVLLLLYLQNTSTTIDSQCQYSLHLTVLVLIAPTFNSTSTAISSNYFYSPASKVPGLPYIHSVPSRVLVLSYIQSAVNPLPPVCYHCHTSRVLPLPYLQSAGTPLTLQDQCQQCPTSKLLDSSTSKVLELHFLKSANNFTPKLLVLSFFNSTSTYLPRKRQHSYLQRASISVLQKWQYSSTSKVPVLPFHQRPNTRPLHPKCQYSPGYRLQSTSTLVPSQCQDSSSASASPK